MSNLNLSDEKPPSDGWVVKKTTIYILVAVALIILTGAVLLAYFVPDRECEVTQIELPDDPETIKMPTPVDIPTTDPVPEARLPATVIPYHYDVKLKVYLDEQLDGDKYLDIDGETDIYAICEEATDEITVHIRTMTVHSCEISQTDNDQQIPVSTTEAVSENEFYVIKLSQKLEVGREYRIRFTHTGTLNQTDYYGFYHAKYTENGEEKIFAATQFESRRARSAFPCFDEPALKATFTTTLIYRPGRIALANTEVVRNGTYLEGWIETEYNKTVLMSSYLNAYTIGDWECIYNTSRNNIFFGVCSQPSLIEDTEYALYTGMDQMSMFEDLWNMPFHMTKTDMPALPVFSPGAMENWGLILYREKYIIYNPRDYTPSRKQGVAGVIAHELAHMWYGNAVTMEWWNDLWLNEGFATYFENYGLDYSVSGFYTFDQLFLKDVTYRAMRVDQTGTSTPVSAERTVGRMIYEKGGSLINMMADFLTQDLLFDGLRNYLHRHEWNNTITDDLWMALTETVDAHLGVSMKETLGYDMKDIMDTWVLQMGFPVVTLTRTATNLVTAEQEHFLLDPNDEPQEDPGLPQLGYVWHIPLTYTHEAELNFDMPKRTWLHKTGGTIEIEGATNVNWYIANINQTTFIRVNYDTDNWRKLIIQLLNDHEVLPVRNRVHLIDDAFTLGEALYLDHVIALEAMEYLDNEIEYSPWQAFVADQWYTKYMIWRTSTYGMFEKYVRHLVTPNYNSLGWGFENYAEEIDYYRILDTTQTACSYSLVDCITEASTQYQYWMENPDDNKIEENMRSTVYCTSIRYGGDAEWAFAYKRQMNDTEERSRLQSALACSRQPWTLNMYMEKAMDDESLSVTSTIGYVRDNSGLGFDLAWDFTMKYFDTLHESNSVAAFDLVWSFASKMNTENDLLKLNAFGAKYYDMPGESANDFYRAVQRVETNIIWADRNMVQIKLFLQAAVEKIAAMEE
ncbi:aminopeptidase N-like [Saccoglossus kowalevskii]|uniref:Aminopeptidase n=1 Tax=Saccoglossus kowalevskii TaxID=10224 RepID=A0ABM0MB96_SACKO|nr:PREDICTED: aminopeptidase N-like [Saccoglossus kowalevskii]